MAVEFSSGRGAPGMARRFLPDPGRREHKNERTRKRNGQVEKPEEERFGFHYEDFHMKRRRGIPRFYDERVESTALLTIALSLFVGFSLATLFRSYGLVSLGAGLLILGMLWGIYGLTAFVAVKYANLRFLGSVVRQRLEVRKHRFAIVFLNSLGAVTALLGIDLFRILVQSRTHRRTEFLESMAVAMLFVAAFFVVAIRTGWIREPPASAFPRKILEQDDYYQELGVRETKRMSMVGKNSALYASAKGRRGGTGVLAPVSRRMVRTLRWKHAPFRINSAFSFNMRDSDPDMSTRKPFCRDQSGSDNEENAWSVETDSSVESRRDSGGEDVTHEAVEVLRRRRVTRSTSTGSGDKQDDRSTVCIDGAGGDNDEEAGRTGSS